MLVKVATADIVDEYSLTCCARTYCSPTIFKPVCRKYIAFEKHVNYSPYITAGNVLKAP